MFGYVKIFKPELKIKDYEAYKAVYCSLCRELGKNYGLMSRGLLSYDVTLYVLFQKSVNDNNSCGYSYKKGACCFNPLKKCNYVSESDDILKEASAITILLSYYKILDNIKDGNLFKRFIYKIVLQNIKRKYKKASVLYPELNKIISIAMQQQEDVETEKSSLVDLAADPSAKALSAIFSYGIKNNETKRIAERFGYCLGRWVYLADAFDDIPKDLKTGNYNAFIIQLNIKDEDYDIEPMKKALRLTANEAALAFNLLELNQYKNILENIVYDGLENQLNLICKKRGELTSE